MDINLSKIKKILIVRLSSLGDILLTTPLLRSIKQNFPQISTDFLLREEYSDLLILNPNVNKIYNFPVSKFEKQDQFNEQISQNYDLVIDLQNNIRSRKLVNILRRPSVKFNKQNLNKFLLVNFKINRLKKFPQIPERYAETVPGLELDDKGLEFYTNRQPDTEFSGGKNYIGLCPGAKHFTKRWLKEYYIELGRKLEDAGYTVCLFGGLEDIEICSEICKSLGTPLSFCNYNDILQTASNMKMCKAIFSNDSGLMHLAAALKLPVIAFFGSTVKEFGFFPYKTKNIVLENKNLKCRPCTHIGRKNCPKKHFKCIKELTPDSAFYSLKDLLTV